MEILAYHKKKKAWQVSFDEAGQIQTGRHHGYYGKEYATEIPIFRAKLKYNGHYQGTKSIMVKFKGCDEDSLIAILKGAGPCEYDMDRNDGFETMEHLIMRDDPFYEYHEGGWFTGIFTFKKQGARVYITPFRGDITKEQPVNT